MRLWPLSTPACPKPFVALGPLGSLYEGTVDRARALGAAHVFAVGEWGAQGPLPGSRGRFPGRARGAQHGPRRGLGRSTGLEGIGR